MRTREELEKDLKKAINDSNTNDAQHLLAEIMLDMRELLMHS